MSDDLVRDARASAKALNDEARSLREYVAQLKSAPRPRMVEWTPVSRDQGDYFPGWDDGKAHQGSPPLSAP